MPWIAYISILHTESACRITKICTIGHNSRSSGNTSYSQQVVVFLSRNWDSTYVPMFLSPVERWVDFILILKFICYMHQMNPSQKSSRRPKRLWTFWPRNPLDKAYISPGWARKRMLNLPNSKLTGSLKPLIWSLALVVKTPD